MTKVDSYKSKLLFGLTIGLSIFMLCFFILGTWIGFEAKQQCNNAQRKYGGECVEALSMQIEDSSVDFRTRNYAIWALGQIGDRRALPVLENLYTGQIPEKEPLDQGISQYELKKAIKLTNGSENITRLIWKYGL